MWSSLSWDSRTDEGACIKEILALLVQGEGDDVADRTLTGQKHDDAVDAGRQAPCGGAPWRKAFSMPPKSARRFSAWPAISNALSMISACGCGWRRAKLVSVADDVVLPGQDIQRIPGFQRLHFACGMEKGLCEKST